MIILAILFCIGFILMCIVGFFHAMIKNRREEKALQYDSSAKYDGVYTQRAKRICGSRICEQKKSGQNRPFKII